ncbi:hypothetical protein VMCG_05117 [Cytospora schulzeri]|uniref:RTA1 like protein n=1 Tax=Cytospora schulzeri TaxID=448051 RepID=A0A423WMB6_9PEZI|nr:hypothetical protein VMCG_05117 [Valsa malicola]
MADNSTSASDGGNTFYECTHVSAMCSVKATTLGYYPNKPLNSFIAAAFGLAMIIQLVFGVWKRTYTFTGFIVAGCALELAGYAGRIALSSNPYNQQAFETQICAIILAPTLICISIYLIFKHVCLALNPSLSRVAPRWLPLIFVPADVSCLLVQAAGGAIAASAGSTNMALLQSGNRAIIAGIALQVVVLLGFGIMSLDYYLRVRRWVHSDGVTPAALALWGDRRFRTFGFAMLGAYVCVQIRCIYRVAEMAGGWGNYIMQDQPSFTVLDSFMMLICVFLLSCFPPGIYFPQMARKSKASRENDEGQDTEQGGVRSESELEPKERITPIRQPPVHAPGDPRDPPGALLVRVLEELLVVLEAAAAALGQVQVRPDAGDGVGGGEDEEDPVLEVVEQDGAEQGDGEVGEAPDHDGDGGRLGTRRRGVDLGRDEPDGGQPADAEGAGGDEEGYGA